MFSRLTVLVAGTAVVVAACGGGGSKTSTAGTSASSSTTAPVVAAHPTVVVSANAKLGSILTDTSGRTLYVFDKDANGKIACAAGCVSIWPPLLLTGTTTPTPGPGVTVALAAVQRPDGGMQVTSGGRPMYTYSGDSSPGQTNGDGFNGIWHVAKPSGNPAPGAAAATTSSSTSNYGY